MPMVELRNASELLPGDVVTDKMGRDGSRQWHLTYQRVTSTAVDWWYEGAQVHHWTGRLLAHRQLPTDEVLEIPQEELRLGDVIMAIEVSKDHFGDHARGEVTYLRREVDGRINGWAQETGATRGDRSWSNRIRVCRATSLVPVIALGDLSLDGTRVLEFVRDAGEVVVALARHPGAVAVLVPMGTRVDGATTIGVR